MGENKKIANSGDTDITDTALSGGHISPNKLKKNFFARMHIFAILSSSLSLYARIPSKMLSYKSRGNAMAPATVELKWR